VNEPLTVAIDKDIFDLAEGFLHNRRGQAAHIYSALELGDITTLRRIGHELKGTAGSYGFRDLSAIGARLETAAVNGDLQSCKKAVDLMSEFLVRVTISPC